MAESGFEEAGDGPARCLQDDAVLCDEAERLQWSHAIVRRPRAKPTAQRHWACLGSGCGENKRVSLLNYYGVLIMRRECSVVCAQCPAIGIFDDLRRSFSDQRFHGNYEAPVKKALFVWVLKVCNGRFLMDLTPQAVPGEFREDREAATADLSVNRAADQPHWLPRSRSGHGGAKGATSAPNQSARNCGSLRQRDGPRSISHEAP